MSVLTLKALVWTLVIEISIFGAWLEAIGKNLPELPPIETDRGPVWRDPPDRPRPRPDRDYLPFLMSPHMKPSLAPAIRRGRSRRR